MDAAHPLKSLLQLQLSTDAQAVLHLPYILSTLSAEALQPSAHTQKWTTRVNSLIYSKDAGARWAGLCIAHRTAVDSKPLMLECAQSWVTAALPLLSRNETVPVLKAAVRLLRTVFTGATDTPEFQRQVSTPNVPKFSAALLALAEKHESEELKRLSIDTLTHIIPVYPTLHRSIQGQLSSVALRYLNGSAPKPTSSPLLNSASKLYAVLHHTGGKVGAANQWRKAVDDTLAFAWGAFLGLRTTFNTSGYDQRAPIPSTSNEDPAILVPLSLDRLRAAVAVLRDLLHASTLRPVTLPIGPIVRLCQSLLSCTGEDKREGYVDPTVQAMELAALPEIWERGCELVELIASCAQTHLQPHLVRLTFAVLVHLEHTLPAKLRLALLRALSALLRDCTLTDVLLSSRAARAVLPSITTLLASQADVQKADSDAQAASKGKKGKKRARGYEGDEVFKISRQMVCPTEAAGQIVLAALHVVHLLLSRANLSSSVQSVAARVLIAVYIGLPHISPNVFSPDPEVHSKVYESVQRVCVELGSGTSSTISKSLGMLINASFHGLASPEMSRELDLQLHPRAPPLIRALPHVEQLSLFRVEESDEESATRRALRVGTMDELKPPEQPEAQVQNDHLAVPPSAPVSSNSSPTTQQVPSARIPFPAVVPATATTQVPVVPPIALPLQQPVPAVQATTLRNMSKSEPSTEPSRYTIQPPTATPTTAAPAWDAPSSTRPLPIAVDEEDDDEPMPTINMDDSDSE